MGETRSILEVDGGVLKKITKIIEKKIKNITKKAYSPSPKKNKGRAINTTNDDLGSQTKGKESCPRNSSSTGVRIQHLVVGRKPRILKALRGKRGCAVQGAGGKMGTSWNSY